MEPAHSTRCTCAHPRCRNRLPMQKLGFLLYGPPGTGKVRLGGFKGVLGFKSGLARNPKAAPPTPAPSTLETGCHTLKAGCLTLETA